MAAVAALAVMEAMAAAVAMAVVMVVVAMVAVMEEAAVGAVMAAAATVVAMVDACTVSHSHHSRCRSRIGPPHRAGLSASPQPHPGKRYRTPGRMY